MRILALSQICVKQERPLLGVCALTLCPLSHPIAVSMLAYMHAPAAVEKLRATEGQAAIDAIDVAAGLSLGEYTALVFAGAMR